MIIARTSLREAATRHWVGISLPGTGHVLYTDDLDDPIVKVQRRVNTRWTAKVEQKPQDLQAITDWLEVNASRITTPC